MTPPNQLRVYGNTEERTWRVGNEEPPRQWGDMPWMLLYVFALTTDNLEGETSRAVK